MIVKRRIDVDELEQALSSICDKYCKYPLIWDEDKMKSELAESEICRFCPVNEILSGVVVEDEL